MAVARPAVHVFSRIPCIISSLQKHLPRTKVVNIDVPDQSAGRSLSPQTLDHLREAEILLCDPKCITEFGLLYSFPKLRWMQSTWAGVDPLMRDIIDTKPPGYTLTRFAGCFGVHMAEYVIGNIIAHQRHFAIMKEDQGKKIWKDKISYRLLSELTLGILGVGDIGREIAKAAKVFGMQVWGLTSQDEQPRCPSPHVDQYRGPAKMSELLEACDYVVNVLPSTPHTRGLLSGDALSICKKSPVFINIGRGDVIDEKTILHALSENWLSGAILDVLEKEPLPADSPLWTHPHVTITPHCSGVSFDWQVTELFVANYEKYIVGKPLDYIVDWQHGY